MSVPPNVTHPLRPSGSLFLLIIFIITHPVFAQPLHLQFQHLTDKEGLSNNRVWAITQDKFGLIWIGSGDGLNRYDGYKVDVYRNERGNKTSLPSNHIRCLFTDSQGIVWIGTANGLALYNNPTNSFKSYFLFIIGAQACLGSYPNFAKCIFFDYGNGISRK